MHTRPLCFVAILGIAVGMSGAAVAGVEEYTFEPLKAEVKIGADAVIAVRLVHKPTGKPVPNAVIFARRADMAPDGMATMTADLEPLPTSEAGIYRFNTNLPMAGNWQISLAAKIQGETGTYQNKFQLRATE